MVSDRWLAFPCLASRSPNPEVYRSDLMEVRQTPAAGLGLFSTAPLARGTCLISEAPLLVLSDMGNPADLYSLVTELPEDRASAFWELAAYKRRREEVQWIPSIRAAYSGPSAAFDAHCSRVMHAWHIYETNRFTVRSASGARDKLGLFPRSARVNHSCHPNVFHRHNHRLNRLTIYALEDIQPDTELATSYIDIVHATPERRRILSHWGFKCGCVQCKKRDPVSEQRRAKLEGLFARVHREAADREGRELDHRGYSRASGELETVLRLMEEEGLDECDTSGVALGLAAECAEQLGGKDMAISWARRALEVEERCLGKVCWEWDATKARLDRITEMTAKEQGNLE